MLHKLSSKYSHEQLEHYLRSRQDLPFPAYFTKVYVSWGVESFVVNLNTFEVEESNFHVKISTPQRLVMNEYSWSGAVSPGIVVTYNIGNLQLVANLYENKEIRTGFSISGIKKTKDMKGALVKPYYINKIKLRGLRSKVPLKSEEAKEPARITTEEFYVGNDLKTEKIKVY